MKRRERFDALPLFFVRLISLELKVSARLAHSAQGRRTLEGRRRGSAGYVLCVPEGDLSLKVADMRAPMLRRIGVAVLAAAVPGCHATCAPPKATPPPHRNQVPVAVLLPPEDSLGSISGRVRFAGTPPNRAPIDMSDPACACLHPGASLLEESVEVGDGGGLKNVMAWVLKGLDPKYSWPVPAEAVILKQAGCVYAPHVMTIQARQPLEVRNEDDTNHNFHTFPRLNEPDNFSQSALQIDLLTTNTRHRTFMVAEEPFRCGCDIHGWMRAWVGVFKHPFHAVTGDDGRFRLVGVPEGKVTLRLWHEKLGTRDIEVEVKRGANASVEGEFSAP
ncbi:MAG: hypothetical protein AAB322_02630 [Pseudomonadota bacterium]